MKNTKKHSLNLTLAIVCAALIIILTLLSATSIGFSSREELVPAVPKSEVVRTVTEGQESPFSGPVVYRVTYTNSFLPRQHQLPYVSACLYNSLDKRGVYLSTRWQV